MMSVWIKVGAAVLVVAVVIPVLMIGIHARQRRYEIKEVRRHSRGRRLWPLRTRKQ